MVATFEPESSWHGTLGRSVRVAGNLLRRNFGPAVENLVRAGLPRAEAEMEAARITGALARNLGYLWSDLRAALSGHPDILALLPEVEGVVDGLPLGPASYAVRIDGAVRRQGTYFETDTPPWDPPG